MRNYRHRRPKQRLGSIFGEVETIERVARRTKLEPVQYARFQIRFFLNYFIIFPLEKCWFKPLAGKYPLFRWMRLEWTPWLDLGTGCARWPNTTVWYTCRVINIIIILCQLMTCVDYSLFLTFFTHQSDRISEVCICTSFDQNKCRHVRLYRLSSNVPEDGGKYVSLSIENFNVSKLYHGDKNNERI